MNLQLPCYIAAMSDDGVGGNAKVVGNLLVRHSLHQTYYHVFLPFTQSLSRIGVLADHVGDLCRYVALF